MVLVRGVQLTPTWKCGAIRLQVAIALCVMLAALPLAQAEDPGPADAARLVTARAAIKGLGETLKEQLVVAIKAGGTVSALGACRTIAPVIAEERSRTYGVEVGRTALKVRNPANAPDAFERRVLEEFVRRIEFWRRPRQPRAHGNRHRGRTDAIPLHEGDSDRSRAVPCLSWIQRGTRG